MRKIKANHTHSTYQCPDCMGTGINKKGGPCVTCRANGAVSGFGAVLAFVGAIAGLIPAMVFLVFLVALFVALFSH